MRWSLPRHKAQWCRQWGWWKRIGLSRLLAGGPGESSKARYLERANDLDLEDLACTRELMEVSGLKSLSHKDLCNHYSVGWLKAHEAHFSRDKTLETANLTGTPKKSIFGPVIYRLLKELGSSGLIVEPPMHRTSLVRSRVAIPTQLRAVEKLLEPKSMGLPDTAYMGSKLLEGPRYGKSYGTSQLA